MKFEKYYDTAENNAEEIQYGLNKEKELCYILNYKPNKEMSNRISSIISSLKETYDITSYHIEKGGIIWDKNSLPRDFPDSNKSKLVIIYGKIPSAKYKRKSLYRKIKLELSGMKNSKVLFLLAGKEIIPYNMKKLNKDVEFIHRYFTKNIYTPLSLWGKYGAKGITPSNRCVLIPVEIFNSIVKSNIDNLDKYSNYQLAIADLKSELVSLENRIEEKEEEIKKKEKKYNLLCRAYDKLSNFPVKNKGKSWTEEEETRLWNQYQQIGTICFKEFGRTPAACYTRLSIIKKKIDNKKKLEKLAVNERYNTEEDTKNDE